MCTVLLDGVPALSCFLLPIAVQAHEIMTIEGMAMGSTLHALQHTFSELGAAQCGYCTPGMLLHGKLLRSSHPHARVVGLDTSKAAALPGVLAVITGADLPQPYSIMPVNQDEHALAIDKVRYVGEPVAAVAAVDEATAAMALHHIEVVYEPLRPLMSIAEALAYPENRMHDSNRVGNVHRVVALEFGDVEAGFHKAEYMREDTFFFQGNTHLPMEQHAAVAQYTPDGHLTLWSATQTPHYVQRALATVLGLAASRVRVIDTAAQVAFRPAKPLDNTDLTLSYRKKMVRVQVTRVLRQLAGLPVAPHLWDPGDASMKEIG